MEYGFTNLKASPVEDVQEMIDASIEKYDTYVRKTFDDVKIYPTKDNFPSVATADKDTIYLDNSTGIEYRIEGNEYVPITESLSEEEVRSLFD